MALPVEGRYFAEGPSAFVAEGSGLAFPGTNVTVRIRYRPVSVSIGGGDPAEPVTISAPVLQWRPRLVVPFDMAGLQTQVRKVITLGGLSRSLGPLDSGKLVVVPSSVSSPVTVTVAASVPEGWHATVINHSSEDVTLAYQGGTVVGDGNTLGTEHGRAELAFAGGILSAHGSTLS